MLRPALRVPFFFDDQGDIVNNPEIRQLWQDARVREMGVQRLRGLPAAGEDARRKALVDPDAAVRAGAQAGGSRP